MPNRSPGLRDQVERLRPIPRYQRPRLISTQFHWLTDPTNCSGVRSGEDVSDRILWAANTDPPVNKRDLSTGENGELDSETLASIADPGGSCWTPGNPTLQLEKTELPSTREMLGITAASERPAVNENGQAIQGRGTVAPRHGFEPRFTAPKAAVLPLDDRGRRVRNNRLQFTSAFADPR